MMMTFNRIRTRRPCLSKCQQQIYVLQPQFCIQLRQQFQSLILQQQHITAVSLDCLQSRSTFLVNPVALFPTLSRPAPEATKPPNQYIRIGISQGGNRPKVEANHLPAYVYMKLCWGTERHLHSTSNRKLSRYSTNYQSDQVKQVSSFKERCHICPSKISTFFLEIPPKNDLALYY